MRDWNTVPLGELYAVPSRNGLSRPKRVRGTGYKMVNMGELFAYSRISNQPMELVPMDEREQEVFALESGDLLFARQSLVAEGAGKCSIVMAVPELTTWESHLIRVRLDQSKADPLFYYYYFSSYIGHGNIQSLVMQVAAAGIRGSDLQLLEVPLPPLETQRRIAAILSAYDDLIENNTRRIKALEQAAHDLYREWFVHFRFPGHESVEMVDSPLGEIPEGWYFANLKDITTKMGSGATPRGGKESYKTSGITLIRSLNIYDFEFVESGLVYIDQDQADGLSNVEIQPQDVLLNITGASVNRCCIVPSYLLPARVNQHVMIIRADGVNVNPLYILHTLNSHYYKQLLFSLAQGGATREALTKTGMQKFEILLPPIKLQNQFAEFCQDTHLQETLSQKNRALREARDLLLPRLVSGQLAVDDVEVGIRDKLHQRKDGEHDF